MKKSWESLWHNKFFFQNSNFLHRGVQKSKMKEEILELSPILTLFRPLGMCFTFVNNCYGLCDKTTQCRSSCFLSLARKPHLPNVHFNPKFDFEKFYKVNIDICCLDSWFEIISKSTMPESTCKPCKILANKTWFSHFVGCEMCGKGAQLLFCVPSEIPFFSSSHCILYAHCFVRTDVIYYSAVLYFFGW